MGDLTSKRSYSYIPRSRILAVVAFLALCASVIEIVDLFNLPFEGSISGALVSGSLVSTDLLRSVLGLGYAGLFILMVMESASLPIPSEVVLPFAGYLVYLGRMNLGVAIADGTAAGLIGALIDYYLALKLGRPIVLRLLGRFGVTPELLAKGEVWVDSKGSWSVLIARFIPGLRSVISIPAGLLEMKPRLFAGMTLIGSFTWSALLIYLGFSAGPLWQSALRIASTFLTQALLYIVAAISLFYVVYYLLQGRRAGTINPPTGNVVQRALNLEHVRNFIKFNIVGLTGIVVNEGLLIALTSAGIYYLYSSGIAIEASIISNFVMNDSWTFRHRRSGHAGVRFAKFNVLMLLGLVVNLAIVYVGTTDYGIHYAISNLVGIAAAFLLRYGLSVKYTWMKVEEIEEGTLKPE
jgi:membrane protein DedA with SNARE-associated domain/putative flippase GtrA